jgi:hypothetical protein
MVTLNPHLRLRRRRVSAVFRSLSADRNVPTSWGSRPANSDACDGGPDISSGSLAPSKPLMPSAPRIAGWRSRARRSIAGRYRAGEGISSPGSGPPSGMAAAAVERPLTAFGPSAARARSLAPVSAGVCLPMFGRGPGELRAVVERQVSHDAIGASGGITQDAGRDDIGQAECTRALGLRPCRQARPLRQELPLLYQRRRPVQDY